MNKENNDNQFEKLINSLEGIQKPSLSAESKRKLKNRVFSKLEVQESTSIIQAIKAVVSSFKLDNVVKTRIKENVFAAIESRSQKKFTLLNLFRVSQRYVSLALVVVMFSGFFSFLSLDTSIARAASFSTIDSFTGPAAINRDGKFLPVFKGLNVKEHDRIFTADNTELTVKYFDDSINRLAENTVIEINELDEVKDEGVGSYVEVTVHEGTVWSKVVNLNDVDSSFVMELDDLQVEADGTAAFNVEVDEGQAEVEVFTSSVEVVSIVEDDSEKIIKGEKVVLDVENNQVGKKKKIRTTEKSEEWVEENLLNDQVYVAEVQEDILTDKIELAGIEVKDDINFDNSFREETVLFLTFDDVKKQKIELDLAEKNFIEAQVKLHDENLSDEDKIAIEEVIGDFEEEVKEFYYLIDEVDVKDSKYANELKDYVDLKIIDYKKDLSLSIPESPTYEIKDVVDNLELLTAESKEEVVEIKIEQAEQKIDLIEEIVIDDVVESSDITDEENEITEEKLVEEVIEEYTDDMTTVIEMIEYIEEDTEVKEDIVEDLKEDFDLIESIEDDFSLDIDTKALKSDIVDAVDQIGLDTDLIEEKVYYPVVITPVVEEVEEIKKLPYELKIDGNKILPPLFK